jgi:hypothetical protein
MRNKRPDRRPFVDREPGRRGRGTDLGGSDPSQRDGPLFGRAYADGIENRERACRFLSGDGGSAADAHCLGEGFIVAVITALFRRHTPLTFGRTQDAPVRFGFVPPTFKIL